MNYEDRLREAFQNRAQQLEDRRPEIDEAEAGTDISPWWRARRWQNGALVAAVAAAAMVLVIVAVGNRSADRVVTGPELATQPTASPSPLTGTTQEEPATTALPTATDPVPPEGAAETLPDIDGEPVRDPNHNQIVGDGVGGFVAFLPQTRDQVLAGIVAIVRSDDGEEWFASHDWRLPEGHRMGSVRHVDGHFVALVENSGGRGFRAPLPMINPRLALSTDLVSWHWIELGLNPPEVPVLNLNPRHTIGEVAINGDDVMISIMSHPRNPNGNGLTSGTIVSAEHRRPCGGSWTEAGPSVLLWCDGEIETAGPGETGYGFDLRPPQRRLLLSEAGADAVEVDTFQAPHQAALNTWAGIGMHIVFPAGDDFSVFGVREIVASPAFGDWAGSELIAVARRSNQERVLLIELDGRYGALVLGGEELGIGEFPEEVVAEATFKPLEQLAVGPAGWAALITDLSINNDLIEQDGWVITGLVRSGNVVIGAEDGSERHWFNSTRSGDLAPGVERGMFGEMRFYRPGTNDILVELTAEQIEAAQLGNGSPGLPALVAQPSATFDRSTSSDGWTLSGDAVRGPLVLTSPSGIETEFADGFAFDNDDIADRVETDFDRSASSANFVLELAEVQIQFFDDDGIVLVEFSSQQVFDDMIEPEYALVTSNDLRSTLWVVFSPDGIEWEVIWSGTSDRGAWATKVIVGDDEVLVDTGPRMERISLDD